MYCWIQPLKLFSQTACSLSNKWIALLFTWVFLHVLCFAIGEAFCQPLFFWWDGSACPRLCVLEIPMLLRARETQALGLCWMSLTWPGWGSGIPGPRQLWAFRLIHPLSKRAFCVCMYAMWCFIIVYTRKVSFFPPVLWQPVDCMTFPWLFKNLKMLCVFLKTRPLILAVLMGTGSWQRSRGSHYIVQPFANSCLSCNCAISFS